MLSLSNRNGFTLIEVMTALVILSVSLVGLLGLRNKDIALSRQANHIIEATLLARQKIAERSFVTPITADVAECEFEKIKEYRCSWELKPTPFPQVHELVVKVLWDDRHQEQTVQFTKYLFQELPPGQRAGIRP